MSSPCHRLLCFFATCLLVTVCEGEVSKSPPPAYDEWIRPLLTPLEEVAGKPDPHAGTDEPGTVRLAERVTRVSDDGTYLRVVHYIFQPYTEKGAELVANDRYRFQSRQETVHLALARTVLADGTEKFLGPNAAFIQKGRRGSSSIYDDGQDLVIVFPDVKPGVLCEVVVVYEREEPTVKGGYSEVLDWSGAWPVGEKRHVLDLPLAWRDRLKEVPVGKPGATREELESPEDRARFSWTAGPVASGRYEPSAAPAAQAGPATWLGTFATWDEMAAWYQELLAERDELDDALRAKVDEWTEGAESPREVLGILFDRVANDVRYEGLEFGISGLQPYSCATVWANQYGDCKDKANLLVAMLKHKGIAAKLVLVNTDHAGLVAKEAPGYHHFDHAIAVVELPAGDGSVERVFCDATLDHGRPGLLSPVSADREVLAIDGGKALWLRTPAVDAGEDAYGFDLELTEDGRLAGWLTVTSRGYYGLVLANRFSGVDRDTARERLDAVVGDFVAGAEVVDFVLPDEERTVDETVVKVYFTGPARQTDHDGRLSVPFPSSGALFNDYGEPKLRKSSYFQWRDRIRVDATVRLPAGWRPESLPPPLTLDTPVYRAVSSWRVDAGVCKASLVLECLESVIPPEGIAAPAQANRAMAAWLEAPLLLKPGVADSPAKPEAPEDPALPLMPSGEGQLGLVDRLFPRGSNAAKRRAALEKTARFFPDDPATVFGARLEIAYLHVGAEDFGAAAKAFSELVKRRPDGVDAETFAYARYLQAVSMKHAGDEDGALEILRDLAADATLDDYRRGWSAANAGSWLAARRPVPAEALALLRQAVELEDEFSESALVALIPALARAGEGEALVTMLAEGGEFGFLEDGGAAVIEQMTVDAKADGDTTSAAELLPWLEKARDRAGDDERKKLLADASEVLADWLARGDAYAAARAAVVAALEKLGPRYFEGKAPADSAEKVEKKLAGLYEKDREAWMSLAAGYFRKFEPTPGFAHILWQFQGYLANMPPEENRGLFLALAEAAAKLPKSDSDYWDCRFIEAFWLRDRGELEAAEAIYRGMLGSPAMPRDFQYAGWSGLGEALELQAKWEEAAECYLQMKDDRHGFRIVAEDLLRAGLLLARIGKEEEALATWALLADVPETTYDDSALLTEINEAVFLSRDAGATRAQWRRLDAWWKKHFVPYFKSLGEGSPGEPRIYLTDQGTAVDLRGRKAVAGQDMTVVVQDVDSVASSFRWLPCQLPSLRQMVATYARPLRPKSHKLELRMIEEAAAAIDSGTPLLLEFARRLHAGLAFDRGEHELVLELLGDQFAAEEGRSAEHRERSGFIFGLAAAATGKEVGAAMEYSAAILDDGPGFVGEGGWACLHADLLAKDGKQAEAVAFLREKSGEPRIKGSAEELTKISEKLAAFSKQGGRAEALAASADGFLGKYRPSWFDYVGPADLQDPRVGDPEKILDGNPSRFHAAEMFRLKMLMARSPELAIETREKAFSDAVLAAGKWRTTWREALGLWSHVIDDEALPVEFRLHFLWLAAADLAAEGQVELLAGLRDKPLFGKFSEDYIERYFPILEEIANARISGPAALAAGLERIGGREIDLLEFQLMPMYHFTYLVLGDADGAAAARTALKDWKLAPQAAGGRIAARLAWTRQASGVKDALALDAMMKEDFMDAVAKRATDAPEGWQGRIDVTYMNDLTDDQADTIRAALVATGVRHDHTAPRRWFAFDGFWLPEDDAAGRAKVREILPRWLKMKDDQWVSLALSGVLMRAGPLPDTGWSDLDDLLQADPQAGKRRQVDALIGFWRVFRDFKPGDPLDPAELAGFCERLGVLTTPAACDTLAALMVNGDKKGLEAVLDDIDAEKLANSFGFVTYLQALRTLERGEELELAMESAERVIVEEMMTAWMDGDPSAVRNACDLAIECGMTALLPEAWRREMPGITADKLTGGLIRARVAALDGNWAEVRKALGDVEASVDDDETSWHWLMGQALAKLGEPEQARVHLDKVIARGLLKGRYFHRAWVLANELAEEKK